MDPQHNRPAYEFPCSRPEFRADAFVYRSCPNWPFFRADSLTAVFKIVTPDGHYTGFFGRDHLGSPDLEFIFIVTAAHALTQAATGDTLFFPPAAIEIHFEFDCSRYFAYRFNQLCRTTLVDRGEDHDWVICWVDDAAFLQLSNHGVLALPFAEYLISEAVNLVGHPRGRSMWSASVIHGVNQDAELVHSAPAVKGSSGSPLVDIHGNAVGVHIRSSQTSSRIFAYPTRAIREYFMGMAERESASNRRTHHSSRKCRAKHESPRVY